MSIKSIANCCTLRKLIILGLVVTLFVNGSVPVAAQAFGANPTIVESQTAIYVVYSYPDEEIFTIELRDQQPLSYSAGGAGALVSIRADSLIAYNLTFETGCSYALNEQGCTNGASWTEIDFLPLLPGHTLDLGSIDIQPGGYFTVQASKFGLEDNYLDEMTLLQLGVLGVHLVGLKPPTGWHDMPKYIIDSFKTVIGPIGSIASILSELYEAIFEGDDLVEALDDVAKLVLDTDEVQEGIAKVINLIAVNAPEVTGEMVGEAFDGLELLNVLGNVKRTIDAFNQMRNHPEFATATITLAPAVTAWPERYQVLEINEPYETQIALRNMGSEYWTPEEGYELWVMLDNWPLQPLSLDTLVAPGDFATWSVPQEAPLVPGIYRLGYQMTLYGTSIGPSIPAEIVVVPENSNELTALIEAMVENAKREAGERFDEFIADLERRITEALLAEIERRLREICGGTGGLSLLVVGFSIKNTWRRKRHHGT